METDNQKLINILERKIQLIRDTKNTQLYHQAVMDYNEYISSSKELIPVLDKIVAEDLITPYYLKEIFNDCLICQHLKYKIPQQYYLPNFYNEEVEKKYRLMKNFAELIKSDYDETEFPIKIHFNPNIPIIKTKREDDFFYAQKLHNDIIEKLETKPENEEKSELNFDSEKSILHIQNKAITISKNAQSSAHDLLRTIFKNKTKVWNTDEVIDDWHYYLPDEKPPKNKVYQAGLSVNRIIAQDTNIKDFLDISTKSVSINTKYLK